MTPSGRPIGDRPGDPGRLRAITRSGLLETTDAVFDRYTRLAQVALEAPISLFTIVDDQAQFFVAHSGLPGSLGERREAPLELSFCRHVVVDDEPLVISDSRADERTSDNSTTEAHGFHAYLGVPVHDHDDHVLGSLCVIDYQPRPWSDRHLGAMRDLADALETELRLRSTSATLTARLDAERTQLALVEALATAASATSGANSRLATAEALIAHGAAAVGASSISLALVDDDELVFHHDRSAGPEVAREARRVPMTEELPMTSAAATGRPVRLGDRDELARWPSFLPLAERLGLESFLAIPIGSSSPSAVIGLGWTRPMGLGDPAESVDRLAALARSALGSSERFEAERDHARALEGLVLPPLLPSTASVDIAGSYLAPERGQRVGGDVYDATVRDDGVIGLLVADAVGHDLLAARTSVSLRHAVAMSFLEGASPAEILRSVNRYVAGSVDGRLATATVLQVDAVARSVTVANAGHPRPLIIAESGVAEAGPTGQPLLGFTTFSYAQSTHAFPPGAAIVAYTDGLVERAGGELADAGRLAVANLGRSATETVRDLMATVDEFNRDDVAVLVAVHRAGDGDDERGRALQIMSAPDRLDQGTIRHEIRTWARRELSGHPVPPRLIDDLGLAATELLSNARDASPRSDSPIGVRVDVVGDQVELTVQNVGRRFRPSEVMPDATAARGRGLPILAALADDLAVSEHGEFVEVRALFTLDGDERSTSGNDGS